MAKWASYADVPAGQVRFELRNAREHRCPARRRPSATALTTRSWHCRTQTSLVVLRDGRAEGGQSHLRVMHAAHELGRVDVRLGDLPVANGLGTGDLTGYKNVGPGAYALTVTRPGGGSPITSEGAVTLTAGTSSTAFVIGTGGEPVRTVVASDRAAAPRGPVATGLGGLAGENPDVLFALLAGLLGALAGGVIYMALTARSRGGGS